MNGDYNGNHLTEKRDPDIIGKDTINLGWSLESGVRNAIYINRHAGYAYFVIDTQRKETKMRFKLPNFLSSAAFPKPQVLYLLLPCLVVDGPIRECIDGELAI